MLKVWQPETQIMIISDFIEQIHNEIMANKAATTLNSL